MIEIYNIFFQIFILLLFFLFPLNPIIISSNQLKKLNLFDVYIINTIFYLLLFLFFSLINVNFKIYYFILVINFLLFIFNFKKFKKFLIDEDKFKYLFFIFCFFVLSIKFTVDPKLSWDGIAHWFLKSQNFFQGENYENISNLAFSYYPHLGSYIWSVFWKINPSNLEYLGRFFFLFCFLITIFSASNLYKKNDFNYFIITFVIILTTYDNFLMGGYQEYLMFFLFYSFVFFFKKINDENKIHYFLISFLVLSSSMMIWVKQEGLFSAILLSIIAFFFIKKNFKTKLLITSAIIALLIISIEIKKYYHGSFEFNESIINESLLNYLDLKILGYKIFQIIVELLKAFIKYPIWIIILIIIGLNLYLRKKKKTRYG